MHEKSKAELRHIINGIGVADRRRYARSNKPSDKGVSVMLVELQKDLINVIDMEEELENGAEADQGTEGNGVQGSSGEASGVSADGLAEADPGGDSTE